MGRRGNCSSWARSARSRARQLVERLVANPEWFRPLRVLQRTRRGSPRTSFCLQRGAVLKRASTQPLEGPPVALAPRDRATTRRGPGGRRGGGPDTWSRTQSARTSTALGASRSPGRLSTPKRLNPASFGSLTTPTADCVTASRCRAPTPHAVRQGLLHTRAAALREHPWQTRVAGSEASPAREPQGAVQRPIRAAVHRPVGACQVGSDSCWDAGELIESPLRRAGGIQRPTR